MSGIFSTSINNRKNKAIKAPQCYFAPREGNGGLERWGWGDIPWIVFSWGSGNLSYKPCSALSTLDDYKNILTSLDLSLLRRLINEHLINVELKWIGLKRCNVGPSRVQVPRFLHISAEALASLLLWLSQASCEALFKGLRTIKWSDETWKGMQQEL